MDIVLPSSPKKANVRALDTVDQLALTDGNLYIVVRFAR